MLSTGFPGDEDPRFAEPEFECDKCDDLLMQDMFNEWFCPTCTQAEKDKEEAQP